MANSSKPKAKFGSTPLFAVRVNARTKTLTMAQCFDRVVDVFVEFHDDIYSLLEVVSLSCTLIEATIKAKLRSINPVLTLHRFDPVSIAIASKKQKRLREKTDLTLANLPSAPASDLLDRFAIFFECKEKSKLKGLMDIRNQLVHSAEDATVDKREVTLLLTKYIFVFLERYLPIKSSLWDEVVKLREVAHSEFATTVMRDIVRARRYASRLSARHLSTALASQISGSDVVANTLMCPACGHENMAVEVEVETSPDEYIVRHSATCAVCELHLNEEAYTEIVETPDKYFLKNEGLDAWEQAVIDADNFLDLKYANYEPDDDYLRAA